MYLQNLQNAEKNYWMFVVVVDLLERLDIIVQKQNSIVDMETVQWQLLLELFLRTKHLIVHHILLDHELDQFFQAKIKLI